MLLVLVLMTRIFGGEGIWWTTPISESLCLVYAAVLFMLGKRKNAEIEIPED